MATVREECLAALDQIPHAALADAVDRMCGLRRQLAALLRGSRHRHALDTIQNLEHAIETATNATQRLVQADDIGRRYAESL